MPYTSRITAAVLAAGLALSACAPTTQGTGPQNRAQSGAVTGAVLGGLLGAAVDDSNRGRGAVIGAVGGAIAGGAIGDYLDRQEAALNAQIQNDDVRIVNTGEALIVTMPEGILFDFDSASIRPSLQGDLRALARNLNQYPQSTIDVIGHTDDTGSAAYNQDLSARRAAAVAGVLLEQGVAPSRVRSYGRGESQPVASNATASGRQLNRRVEVVIRPTV